MLALSTAWLGGGRATVEDTIRAGVAAGFAAFEIGVAGRTPPAASLVALAGELGIAFTSVHNIAFREELGPDEVRGDGLSSLDPVVRRRAIDGTARTIQFARDVGARCVVVHAGDVEVPRGNARQHEARRLIEGGRRAEALSLMNAAMSERNALAARHVETAAASLAEALRLAGDFPLALECRVHYYSIPLPGELEFIRRILGTRPIYYWHDTGHARICEILGLSPQLAWLERFGGILAGFHLHDVRGVSDHEVPGTGDLDFAALRRYMSEDTLKVIELPASASAAGLVAGRRHLEAIGIA